MVDHRVLRRGRAQVPRAAAAPINTTSFLARFLLLWIALQGVLACAPSLERWAIQATVSTLALSLSLFAKNAIVLSSTLDWGSTTVAIVSECTPILPIGLLSAAIVSFPASLTWKIAGVVIGAAMLWIYNIGRLLLLIALRGADDRTFDFFHVYVWQTMTLVVLLGLFAAWLRLLPKRTERCVGM